MSDKTLDLLAELVSEFTASKKPLPKPAARPTPAPKPDLSTQRGKEAYLDTQAKHWIPSALIYHVHEQTCQCCGETVEFIGSTLVRHVNSRIFMTWDIARTASPEHQSLPREYFTHQYTVEECPSCLRAGAYLNDFPPAQSVQRKLFN